MYQIQYFFACSRYHCYDSYVKSVQTEVKTKHLKIKNVTHVLFISKFIAKLLPGNTCCKAHLVSNFLSLLRHLNANVYLLLVLKIP